MVRLSTTSTTTTVVAALLLLACHGPQRVQSLTIPPIESLPMESLPTSLDQVPDAVKGVAAAALLLPVAPSILQLGKSVTQSLGPTPSSAAAGNPERRSGYVTYPEGQAATYELLEEVLPFEFGDAALIRPLLKQTQLETRPLQLVYDANRDGYNARVFHQNVDGKGASVVLCKVDGKWCGGYNPRGWASLGQARSSVAAFLFYQTGNVFGNSWQKVRASRTGSMACGNDLYDAGIYFGADSLVIPLSDPNPRSISSRLGQYFEARPEGGSAQYTVLPRPAVELRCQELKVFSGVYEPGEDIPNSGGVLELGYY